MYSSRRRLGDVDANLAIKALERAYEQRGKPVGVMFHFDQESRHNSLRFAPTLMAIEGGAEYEPSWELLGQFTNRATV